MSTPDIEKRFDLLIFVMRGRLVHKGHTAVIDKARALARNVLVLVGSANRSRNEKGNEFIADEVVGMLRAVYPDNEVITQKIDDFMYDEQDLLWLANVQKTVAKERKRIQQWSGVGEFKVGLIGFSKDRTSYYLNKFPAWESVDVEGYRYNGKIVSATELREEFFYGEKYGTEAIAKIRNRIPEAVARWLYDWAFDNHPILSWVREEREFITQYRKDHKFAGKQRYNPSHTTCDNIVIQSGHVLLIRRGKNPGKGKWALPGGFVNEFEGTRDASLRELSEETRIKLSKNVLRLAWRMKLVFGDPHRSSRGRIYTHTHVYLLNDRREFPEVDPKGGDDADATWWAPLGELDDVELYEDHGHQIRKAIGMLALAD